MITLFKQKQNKKLRNQNPMMAEKQDTQQESSWGISAFCFYPKQLINQSTQSSSWESPSTSWWPHCGKPHQAENTCPYKTCLKYDRAAFRVPLRSMTSLCSARAHTRDIKKGVTRTKPNPRSHSFERYQPMPHPAGILRNFPHGGVLKRLLPHPSMCQTSGVSSTQRQTFTAKVLV